MENKIFRKTLNTIAKNNGFESVYNGWFRESQECIVSLYLQKSGYSNLYYLNIRIFVQGFYDKTYIKSKDLDYKEGGGIFRRQPIEYDNAFDLENLCSDEKRIEDLQRLFKEFLVPYTDKALSKNGILELYKRQEIFLLPTEKAILGIIE